MPSVRCELFDDLLWTYVAEVAKRRKMTRCKALEKIVEEHIRFMAEIELQKKSDKTIHDKKKKR
jgi:predicted DNA-binding ribbon-helix-helix protein